MGRSGVTSCSRVMSCSRAMRSVWWFSSCVCTSRLMGWCFVGALMSASCTWFRGVMGGLRDFSSISCLMSRLMSRCCLVCCLWFGRRMLCRTTWFMAGRFAVFRRFTVIRGWWCCFVSSWRVRCCVCMWGLMSSFMSSFMFFTCRSAACSFINRFVYSFRDFASASCGMGRRLFMRWGHLMSTSWTCCLVRMFARRRFSSLRLMSRGFRLFLSFLRGMFERGATIIMTRRRWTMRFRSPTATSMTLWAIRTMTRPAIAFVGAPPAIAFPITTSFQQLTLNKIFGLYVFMILAYIKVIGRNKVPLRYTRVFRAIRPA